MNDYAPLLAALVALLAGLTIGKAWERYKLRDGTWIDRRRVRESPHYILGLNFLVTNQIDLAIEVFVAALQRTRRAAIKRSMNKFRNGAVGLVRLGC